MDAFDLAFYRHHGHLTVNGVFAPAETDAVIADVEAWGESFLADLPPGQRAWYIDDATLENGCLYSGDGTNQGPVYGHVAPAGEPFNLQLPQALLDKQPMVPAPVRKGGVSFHHGNTFHQSGPNHSTQWRRACALHYVRNGVDFAIPALPYDHTLKLRVT